MSVVTADELFLLPEDGWHYELVRGELRKRSPSGSRHGRVAARIITSLSNHVEPRRLGGVYASESGFRIGRAPDTVRAPDAAFVRAERLVDTPRFFEGPPDAVFEVISPNDRYTEIEEKTRDWLRAGVQAVVIVDPDAKSAAEAAPPSRTPSRSKTSFPGGDWRSRISSTEGGHASGSGFHQQGPFSCRATTARCRMSSMAAASSVSKRAAAASASSCSSGVLMPRRTTSGSSVSV